MTANILAIGPHVEGVIRIEANQSADAEGRDVLTFLGSMEVHSRVHDVEGGELHNGVPKHQAHPITEKLMQLPVNAEAGKLKEIPIRLFFNTASNALKSRYQAYNMGTGVPACSGDGRTAVRRDRMELSNEASRTVDCHGPEVCDYALSGQATCRRQVALTVQIVGQDDPLSVFQLRSSSYHTYKALAGQLAFIEKRFAGLRHVPLKLKLWTSSSRLSNYREFDLFKLALDAATEVDAMKAAKAARHDEETAGLCPAVDDAYAADGDATQNSAADDFDLTEQFYQERDGQSAAPRVQQDGAIGKTAPAGNNLASNVLTAALSAARGAAESGAPRDKD